MPKSLKNFSNRDLLKKHSSIVDELIKRGVIRTRNNPIADYAEWLVSNKFKWSLAPSSNTGYDALDNDNIRYQIKCRRITVTRKSRQLGVIRKLNEKKFDFLVGVLFDDYYKVFEAYIIPHDIIEKYSRFSEHQNGYILQLKGEILEDRKTENITKKFR